MSKSSTYSNELRSIFPGNLNATNVVKISQGNVGGIELKTGCYNLKQNASNAQIFFETIVENEHFIIEAQNILSAIESNTKNYTTRAITRQVNELKSAIESFQTNKQTIMQVKTEVLAFDADKQTIIDLTSQINELLGETKSQKDLSFFFATDETQDGGLSQTIIIGPGTTVGSIRSEIGCFDMRKPQFSDQFTDTSFLCTAENLLTKLSADKTIPETSPLGVKRLSLESAIASYDERSKVFAKNKFAISGLEQGKEEIINLTEEVKTSKAIIDEQVGKDCSFRLK